MDNRSQRSELHIEQYGALVRPHLEYCAKVWRPVLKKDIEKLEKVERRAINMTVKGKISYERKLEQLKLFSPEKRRLRGDLIAVFKSFKVLSQINKDSFSMLWILSDIAITRIINSFQEQINAVVVKANKMLGFISRAIEAREPNIILPLYKALTMPHLEYCVKVWRPFLKKDMKNEKKFREEQ